MKHRMKVLATLLLVFTLTIGSTICLSVPTFAGTKKVYLGKYTCTAYCGCRKCNGKYYGCRTASGTKPKAGRTIAVDPKKIKLKTKVMVNGKTYIAEDTGGAIKGKRIDIFFSTHKKAMKFGKKKMKVYKVYKTSGSSGGSSSGNKNPVDTKDQSIVDRTGTVIREEAIKEQNHKDTF